MRISDWSSDVCSSDLPAARFEEFADQRNIAQKRDAFDRLALVVVEQAADREDFAVIDGQHGFERPFVDDQVAVARRHRTRDARSEEHTSELQSLMRNSYAVFCLKKKN